MYGTLFIYIYACVYVYYIIYDHTNCPIPFATLLLRAVVAAAEDYNTSPAGCAPKVTVVAVVLVVIIIITIIIICELGTTIYCNNTGMMWRRRRCRVELQF